MACKFKTEKFSTYHNWPSIVALGHHSIEIWYTTTQDFDRLHVLLTLFKTSLPFMKIKKFKLVWELSLGWYCAEGKHHKNKTNL
jgi:hypothetical protein